MEITEIIRQYTRSGGYNDLAYRRTRSDDIRFAVWEGQDEDGKKHQENNSKDDLFSRGTAPATRECDWRMR